MRLPAHLAIISALLLYCACLCQRANSQNLPAKKNPEATVSGKVTIKGKPAPGVVVGLRASQPTQSDSTFKATTDQDGNYRIADVPGGSFEVAPVAPALVISEASNSRGQTVVITEGENVEGINFELVRGGVITGKVTDADGHPVIEERITLSPVDQGNQRGPVYSASRMFVTDDRGIYRLFGVRPGRYKVSVGGGDNYYRSIGSGRSLHLTTFYPDVNDPAKATVVEIEEGTEATGIDIAMGQTPQGFSVNGRVVDGETGKPVANVAIGLTKIVVVDGDSSRSFGGGTGARSDRQGEFRLENLAPGKYTISVYPPPELNLRAEPVTFDVLDQDVTGLLIKSSMGTSVSGMVVFEGTRGSRAAAVLAQAYVAAYVIQSPNVTSGHSARVNPDGSFLVGGLQAGTANFSIETMGNEKGLTVSRIERDGVVQTSGIQIQNAEKVSGIRIVVTYSSGSIRGVIKTENGTLPPGGRFIMQLMKSGEPNGRLQPGEPDSRGHFLIEGLAAGDYELTVIAFVPGSRQRTQSAKQLVTVTDGASSEVTVTIDLTPAPGP